MNILYALIAFSVVMIVLSTLVVAIVEVVNNLRGMRARHMRYLLGAVFDEYLWPEFGNLVGPPPRDTLRTDQPAKEIPGEIAAPDSWLVRQAALMDVFQNIKGIGTNAEKWRNRPNMWGGAVLWAAFAGLAIWVLPLVFSLVLLIAIILLIDKSRQPERDSFPLWFDLDQGRVDEIKKIEALHLAVNSLPPGVTSPAAEKTVQDLKTCEESNPELVERYRQVAHRRLFLDEILKVARAIATNPGRDKSLRQSQLGVLDFAAHLGRTQFGEAIRSVSVSQKDNARDKSEAMLDSILVEMARRYDSLGQQTTTDFRQMTRRWSVGLAFVVALVANVDAVRLFTAFYNDSELSQRVDTAYSARLEQMSKQEEMLVARLIKAQTEATNEGKASPDTVAEIETLKSEIEAIGQKTRDVVAELTGLGVPVGWQLFPFCNSAPEIAAKAATGKSGLHHPDPDCAALIQAAARVQKGDDSATIRTTYNQHLEQKRADLGLDNPVLFALCDALGDACAHVSAAWMWAGQRLDQGLVGWLMGVVIGGALIGLGGPFWFDFYKRLSSLAQIARAVGFTPRKTEPGEAADTKPESTHAPRSVQEAFRTALDASAQIRRYKDEMKSFEQRALMTETAQEDEVGISGSARPRKPLDPAGEPIV